jgi:hypothetical protein
VAGCGDCANDGLAARTRPSAARTASDLISDVPFTEKRTA